MLIVSEICEAKCLKMEGQTDFAKNNFLGDRPQF